MLDLGTFKVLWDVNILLYRYKNIYILHKTTVLTYINKFQHNVLKTERSYCLVKQICFVETLLYAMLVGAKRHIIDLEQSPLNSLAQGKVK